MAWAVADADRVAIGNGEGVAECVGVGVGVCMVRVGLTDDCSDGDGATRAVPITPVFTIVAVAAACPEDSASGEGCPPDGVAPALATAPEASAGTDAGLSPCAKYTAPASKAALIASKPNTTLAITYCLLFLAMPSSSKIIRYIKTIDYIPTTHTE